MLDILFTNETSLDLLSDNDVCADPCQIYLVIGKYQILNIVYFNVMQKGGEKWLQVSDKFKI